MALIIKPVTPDAIEDLARLFATDAMTDACWCMWFIIPVKAFHAAGHAGNCASFCDLAATSELPLGLLAFQDDEPVGWCAVGPRERYVRAMKTPTYSAAPAEPNIWFVPCFYVRPGMRRGGVSKALLDAAVELARANGATAIDGFPFAGTKRRSGGDTQVGFEELFASCGFEVIRTPSPSRVVMRRALA